MSVVYTSSEGDMLDWICWKYYIQRPRVAETALDVDPRLIEDSLDFNLLGSLDVASMGSGDADGQELRGIIEQVLEANPGLADRGLILAAGIKINLPDIEVENINKERVRLWG